MLIALVSGSTVTKVGDYKELFPNTSFPPSGASDEFLVANSAKKVNLFKAHDKLTQKLESTAPYVEGDWVYTVKVANLTAEEVQSAKDSAMAQLKAQRTALLASSDWTQIPDNPISNKSEWATYRQALRDFPATVADARLPYEFPHDPNWVEPANLV
jgi:hypothetical protein